MQFHFGAAKVGLNAEIIKYISEDGTAIFCTYEKIRIFAALKF